MEINDYPNEVGISKIARQFVTTNNLRIPQSLLLAFRFSGLLVLAFLLYLIFIGLIDWKDPATWFFWCGYLVYELLLEILRKIELRRKLRVEFYDSTYFATVRCVVNLFFITGFIYFAPEARYILAFLYLIPIIQAIILAPDSGGAYGLAIVGAGLGFYIGGISSLVPDPLPWLQAMITFLIIVTISVYVKAVYPRGTEPPPGLFAVSQSLYQTQDINKLVTEIKNISLRITGADRVLVLVVDPVSGRYLHHEMHGFELQDNISIIDVTKDCKVIKSGKPFCCMNFHKKYAGDTIYHNMFHCVPGAVIAQPILNRNKQVIGVINVAYKNPQKEDKNLLRIIQQFSILASRAVEISLEFRAINLDNARNRKAAEMLMNATSELDVMVVLVEKSIDRFPSVEAAHVHRFDPVTKELIHVTGIDYSDHGVKIYPLPSENEVSSKQRMKLGEGIAGKALFYRDSILVNNALEHPWFWKDPGRSGIVSLLAAPLIDPESDEPIGVISLHSSQAGAFSSADEFNIVSLAQQGANTISKFRAVARMEMHDSMLMHILNAAKKFNIALPLDAFCKEITDAAIQVLGFGTACIRLLYPKEKEYVTVALSSSTLVGMTPQRGYRVPEEVIRQVTLEKFRVGRSYLIPNDANEMHELIDHNFSMDDRPESQYGWKKYDGLVTPLFSPQDGQIIGVLTLDHPHTDSQPTRDNIETIGSFAAIAEWAIELSQTHRELAESHESTMSFITSISDILRRTIDSDMDLLGWLVVQIGAELLNAEGCSLHIVDGNNMRLAYSTFLASTSYIGREKPVSAKPGSGLSAWVAATGKPLLIKDREFDQHPAWAGEKEHLQHIKSRTSSSVLLAPVFNHRGRVVGVITLENKLRFGKLVNFDAKDLEKLSILSQQIGMALEIASHYQTIRQWESLGLQDDLHELIGLYHSGVVMQLEVLRDWLAQGNHQKIESIIPRIIKRARTTLVELKTIHTAVYSRYLEMELVKDSLTIIIDTWSKRASYTYENPQPIKLTCPPDLSLPVEVRGACLRIAACAIANAILHSGILEDERIRVEVCVESHGNRTLFRVIDTGRGKKPLEKGFGIKRMHDLVANINKEAGYHACIKTDQTSPRGGITVSFELTWLEVEKPYMVTG